MIISKLVQKYRDATNTLILLDYDGTLVDHVSIPENAKPTEQLLTILTKLIEKPHTDVVIISGRVHHDLERFFGHLPIDIVAEHGAMHKKNGEWVKRIIDNEWQNELLPIFNRITDACPNSFLEEKTFSITWHYRNAPSGYDHSRYLIKVLEKLAPLYDLKILDGNMIVEVMSTLISKGKVGQKIADQNKYDYILSLGDDKTDEEMFEYFFNDPNAATVKVGAGNTCAKYKLENVSKVISLLEQL